MVSKNKIHKIDKKSMERAQDILAKILTISGERDISDFHITTSFVRICSHAGIEALPEFERTSGEIVRIILALLYTAQSMEELKEDGLTFDNPEDIVGASYSFCTEKLKESKVINFSCQGGTMNANSLPSGRMRVQAYYSSNGIGLTARILKEKIPDLNELGFAPDHVEQLKNAVCKRSGLVLITGATGNGKSTTLASILNWVRETQQKHIVTIEDPIEYHYEDHVSGDETKPAKGFITQQEVHRHVDGYKDGLTDALRKHPNIILLGEIRDAETMETCINAAQTGHLVLSTLHTRSTARTLDRVIEMFPDSKAENVLSMLSDSLELIVSQGLLESTGGNNRVLCYEMLNCDETATRSSIQNYKTSPSIKEVLLSTNNIEWDSCLNKLFDNNLITETVRLNASLKLTDENE